MKLYLGCALPPFHGQHLKILGDVNQWTLVDRYVRHPDIKNWDAIYLREVDTDSVEMIYSSHLLEHIEHNLLQETLKNWHRVLQTKGKVVINVPDLEWFAHKILSYESGDTLGGYYNTFTGEHGLLSIFYGSQSHAGEYHKCGFTKRFITELLTQSGFTITSINQFEDAHDMGVILVEATK